MSKAEERAFEVYPPKLVTYSDLFGEEALDDNGLKRTIFIEGYHQAEKDLELTYDDICEIMEIREDVLEMDSYENLYEEVLNRFNELKRK